jgi:hypothetical protein
MPSRRRPYGVVVPTHDNVDRRLRFGLEVHRRVRGRLHLERVERPAREDSWGHPGGGDAFVTATNAASASRSITATRENFRFIALPFSTRAPRRRGSGRAPPAGRRARLPTRGSVEDEEADLVLGNVDRAVEADGRAPLRQLLRGRPWPPLAGGALSRQATRKVGLHQIVGHAFDVRAGRAARKARMS